jgi:LCP family protein required for cell wall assembly
VLKEEVFFAMKKVLNILIRIIIVLIVIVLLFVAGVGAYVLYTRAQKENSETIIKGESGDIIVSNKNELEPTITCLFMGVNDSLTDFIMLGKYDPNTREINLMSIPRDSKVDGTVDGKINSAYARGLNPMNTVNIVTEITGVEIDYYVLFKTKVLRDLVDAVGGVTVTVPVNMNYDDPVQNLHIHLKKGTYKLNGDQAEQFCRFRRYPNGDVDRVKAQQSFIKAMVYRCLEPQNLLKAGDLIEIALKNTQTNAVTDLIPEYIDDAVSFKPDRMRIETLPGYGGYADNGISYFFINEKKAKELIDEMFNKKYTPEEAAEIQEELDSSGETKIDISLISGEDKETTRTSGEKLKIEVLNNGASVRDFNRVVEILNNSGYDVVRVSTIIDTKNELSSITCYSSSTFIKNELKAVSRIVGILKLETETKKDADVDFTIVLGPNYVAD